MAFIKQIPQGSAEFRRQLGQYAVRPRGVKLPLDVIRMVRLPVCLFPLKRLAYLLAMTRFDEVVPECYRPMMRDPHSAHEVIKAVYGELQKARNRQGAYEQIV
jgi:hypothetical protein